MKVSDRTLAYLVVLMLSFGIISSVALFSFYPVDLQLSITGMTSEYEQGVANVTLATEANIHLVVDTVEFHSIAATVGTSNDTVGNDPHAFVVENNGTARLNVSVGESSSDTLWVQNDSAHCFQFNATANGSTSVTQYIATTWTDFDGAAQVAGASNLASETTPNLVWNLSTVDGNDRFNVNLRIEVPEGEEGGVKEATIFFEGTAAA